MLVKRIIQGAINGFPLIRSVVKAVKKDSIASVVNEVQIGDETKYKVDYVVLITEVITAGLVVAFVLGKISLEDIERVLHLIK